VTAMSRNDSEESK